MKYIVATAIIATLAGCSNNTVFRSYSEAGSLVDTGSFGNASMNNTQIMTGEKSYVTDLSSRFASEVQSTVNFAFNSAQLDAAAKATLRQQAHWINQFPEVRFRVYGHTDLVGGNVYNERLGMRRARAVVHYLAQQGIDQSRLEAVASLGETQPLIVTEGKERRNRRTVTEVSGFVEDHQDIIDGKYAEIIHREYVKSAAPKSELSNATSIASTGAE